MNAPEPGQRYWQMLAPIWGSVSIYDGAEEFCKQFSQLRPDLGVLFAAHWLNSEVCNGGFHQFFSNPTGVLAPEAHAAFQVLKLNEASALIRKAMDFFGPTYPREQMDRRAMLNAIEGKTRRECDPFFPLDEVYYRILSSASQRFKLAADEHAGLIHDA